MDIKEQIAQLEGQLGELQRKLDEESAQDTVDVNKIAALNDQINPIRNKLDGLRELAGAQEERVQKKDQAITEFVDIVAEMFESLFPEEVYKELLGVTEYETKRQQFYQVNHAYVSEKLEEVHADYEQELQKQQEKYGRLNEEHANLSGLLLEEERKNEELAGEYNKLIANYRTLESDLEKYEGIEDKYTKLQRDYKDLEDEKERLETKLEQSQKTVAKPSATLSNMLQDIRQQNAKPIKSAAELALEGTMFRGKVIIGSTEEPNGDSFRNEAQPSDSGVYNQYQQPSSIPVQPPELTFRTTEENAERLETEDVGREQRDLGSVAEKTVSRAEFEALKADVIDIRRELGLKVVA